jgi:PAS domain S-box-containing protein
MKNRLAILWTTAVMLAVLISEKAGQAAMVRVGSEVEFIPYAFVDKEGQAAGFSVDLIRAVAQAMGLQIEITAGTWDSVWSQLVAGQLDVLPIVARLPGRARLVDFSLPHTETYDAFFVRPGSREFENLEAARGKEIVVMRSDAAHHALIERNFQGLILVDTIPEGLSLVASGRHDAFLCSKLIGLLALQKLGGQNLRAGPPIPDYKRAFSFAVKQGNAELLEKLNQGLMIVKASGEYQRIYDRWLSMEDPWHKWKGYLAPLALVLLTIILIGTIWLMTLRRLVQRATLELADKNERLVEIQEGLEKTVVERTSDLQEANEALRANITELKRVENALQESDERYRRTLTAVNDGLWDWHIPSGKAFFSGLYYAILGYKDGEFPATYDSWRFLVHPEDIDRVESELRKSVETASSFAIDLRMRKKTGHWLWVSTRGKMIEVDTNGKALRMVGILSDIAERRRVEESLARSRAELRAIYDHAPVKMCVVDANRRILYSNSAFTAFTGILENLLKGGHACGVFGCINALDDPRGCGFGTNCVNCALRLAMEDTLKTGTGHRNIEHQTILVRDGERRKVVLLGATALIPADGQNHLLLCLHDITERKRAEDAVQASLCEKESLLKEIHHRVKNNLQIVSSLLRLQSGQIDHPIVKAALKDMQNRVQSMALIHEHLYQSDNLAQIDMAAYLKSLCPKLVRAMASHPGAIQLHLDMIPALLQIDQAIPCGLLVNELVSNALKHAFPEGRTGEVRVELQPVEGAHQLRLRVADNGIGLPADFDIERLSSLGLHLASDLARQLRGKLEIGSGPGATFDVVFESEKEGNSLLKTGDTKEGK